MQEDKEKQQLYEDYVKQVTPTHSLPANMAKAFLVGGLICVLGQAVTEWALAAGMDAHLAKPIEPEILYRRLRQYIK